MVDLNFNCAIYNLYVYNNKLNKLNKDKRRDFFR